MIKILIVDDEAIKQSRVREVVESFLAGTDYALHTASTVVAAAKELRETQFDLMVLDLNIPMREDEPPRRDGGVRLLSDIKRSREIKRPNHILGLTAFGDLANESGGAFDGELWHIVQYDLATDAWEELLGRKLVHIVESHSSKNDGYDYDLAIVTALHVIELESVLALPGDWRRIEMNGDQTIYHQGAFKNNEKSIKVVAASATEMGMPAATALAMKVIENFRPKYVAMTGIAAGVKGKMNFGDILIADQSWDYGSGKNRTKGRGSVFLPAPEPILISPLLKAKLSHFVMAKEVVREIRANWTRGTVPSELVAHLGPVASGAAVLENQPLIDDIASHNRKLIGVEMETYGVFVAARACRAPRPDAISIKSVCDFGDSTKADAYQAYAAYTSSRFLYEFALRELF